MFLFTALSFALIHSGLSQIQDCSVEVLAEPHQCAMDAFDKVLPSKQEALQLVEDVISCLEPSGCTITDEMKSDVEEFEAERECGKKALGEAVIPKLKNCFFTQRPEFVDIPLPDHQKVMDYGFVLRRAKKQDKRQKQLMDSCGSDEKVEALIQCVQDKSPMKSSQVEELLDYAPGDFIHTRLQVLVDLERCFKSATPSCIKLLVEVAQVFCGCIDSVLVSGGEALAEMSAAFKNCGMSGEEKILLGSVRKVCARSRDVI